jgi:prevent-host-death family protein
MEERIVRQVAFTELRNNAKVFFDLVETGESVRILRNGKPIADIVPIAADLPSWKKRKAQPLVVDGVAISQLILDERSA